MKDKKKVLERDIQSLVKLVDQLELDLGVNVTVNGGSLRELPLYDFLLVMQKSVKTSDEQFMKKYVECISHFCMKISYLNDRWAFQNRGVLDFSLYDHADVLCSFFLQYQEHRDIDSFRNRELSTFIAYFESVEASNSRVTEYLSYRVVRMFLVIFCMGFSADASVVCQFLRDQFWIYEGFNPRSKLSEQELDKLSRHVKIERAKHSKRFRDRMKASVRKVVKTSKSNPSEVDHSLSVPMDTDFEVVENNSNNDSNDLKDSNAFETVNSNPSGGNPGEDNPSESNPIELNLNKEDVNASNPSGDNLNSSNSFAGMQNNINPGEKERIEKERKARLEEEKRLERERLEKERLEKERLEQARLEQERLEQEKLKQAKLEQERLEKERLEKERQAEQERQAKIREQKRIAELREKEKLEQERLERERLEQERIKKERLEQERLERERLERLERMKEEERQRVLRIKQEKERMLESKRKQEEIRKQEEERNKNVEQPRIDRNDNRTNSNSGLRNSSIF